MSDSLKQLVQSTERLNNARRELSAARKAYPQALRRAREDSGLSGSQLSKRSKLSHASIAVYETGRSSPSIAAAERIAAAIAWRMAAKWNHR